MRTLLGRPKDAQSRTMRLWGNSARRSGGRGGWRRCVKGLHGPQSSADANPPPRPPNTTPRKPTKKAAPALIQETVEKWEKTRPMVVPSCPDDKRTDHRINRRGVG